MLIYITPPLVTYVIPILEADAFALFIPGEQPEVLLLRVVFNSSLPRLWRGSVREASESASGGPAVREGELRAGRGRQLRAGTWWLCPCEWRLHCGLGQTLSLSLFPQVVKRVSVPAAC